MTCERVTVDYPSDKLYGLAVSALSAQTNLKESIRLRCNKRINDYEELPWYKRWFGVHPDDFFHYGKNFTDNIASMNVNENIDEIRKIILCCESSDTVRMSGKCLADLSEWANG